MKLEWFISLRYLKAKRKQTFISIITLISVGGVALGVCALIVVISVMGGFADHLKTKFIGLNAHLRMTQFGALMPDWEKVRKKVLTVKGVKGATPFVYGQVMVNSASRLSGAILWGIDPATSRTVSRLGEYLKAGRLEYLDRRSAGGLPGVIIGVEMAKQLGVNVGNIVSLVSPFGDEAPTGDRVPKVRQYRVVGLFQSGMYQFDTTFVYMSITEAGRLLDLGRGVNGLEIKTIDPYLAKKIGVGVRDLLGGRYLVRDWMSLNRNLFAALKLERVTMFIILTLIILVAAFNIVSTLIMVVMEKTKDIAILKSMGANRGTILRIFVYEGLMIGLFGTILGVVGGLVLCWLLKKYQFIQLPRDIYYLDRLPVLVNAGEVIFIAVAAVLICLAATLYPAWQGSRLDPAEAVRYE